MRGAPVDVGDDAVEIPERIAGRNVGEREALAEAELARAEIALHRREPALDLEPLPAMPLRRLDLVVIMRDDHRRIRDAVSQRFPAPDLRAIVERRRDELGLARERV